MAAAIAGAGEVGHDELTQVEFGPENIRMNGDFLKAVRSGNTRRGREIILESEDRTSRGETQSIAIDVPINGDPHEILRDDDTARDRPSCLRGVTIGGDTSLHIVASNGDLELAQLICSRKSSLLVACNQLLETPLHCAARAGHLPIVRHMITSAGGGDSRVGVERMLRATKRGGKTALHEATQNGHESVVRELLSHDRRLAYMVDDEGISPLYMAVLSGSLALVQEFKEEHLPQAESAFYAGPNEQTALHAAVLYSPRYLSEALVSPRQAQAWPFQKRFFGCSSDYEIAKELLKWNRKLARKTDNSGGTPLHYAASVGNREIAELLLEYDPSLAYISDSSGSYPIHVAAVMGRSEVIDELISKCPDSYELLDDQGRNFFHVAMERENWSTVFYFRGKPVFSELMNAADFEGNTPLHLTVKNRNRISILDSECTSVLTMSSVVQVVIDKLKPYPPDWLHEYWVQKRALPSPYSLHHLRRQNPNQNKNVTVTEGLKLRPESLIICSVLIATVTFSAAFTMPGGYKCDGTPILARRFAFKAFIIADALAFILSVIATFWLAFARIGTTKGISNRIIAVGSTQCMITAAMSMVIAFASAVYAVLAPVLLVHAAIVCSVLLIAIQYVPLGGVLEIVRDYKHNFRRVYGIRKFKQLI